ncbi:MAG: SEC-C domain-containing protein, partial [Anaerolineae bacterium]|nr:SEC-C domain-containing protein [Anaerolineae bacterium]
MQDQIERRALQNIFRIQVQEQPQQQRIQNVRAVHGGASTSRPEPARATEKDKLGRNDPCWCGSGKKYKNCHYHADRAERQTLQGGPPQAAGRRRRRR